MVRRDMRSVSMRWPLGRFVVPTTPTLTVAAGIGALQAAADPKPKYVSLNQM
jgi:hypothetical protein